MTSLPISRDAVVVLSTVCRGLGSYAPLAAGYLWLAAAWLILADTLPGRDEHHGDAIDRLYRLQPVISDVGTAIVASVTAYVIGSIVVDLQTGVGRTLRLGSKFSRVPLRDRSGAVFTALDTSSAGRDALEAVLQASGRARRWEQERGDQDLAGDARWVKAANWIAANRAIVKTRLLDISAALHSEVDRPDAEATFRMVLWPPLALISAYLALTSSVLWVWALLLPLALAVQWLICSVDDGLTTLS